MLYGGEVTVISTDSGGIFSRTLRQSPQWILFRKCSTYNLLSGILSKNKRFTKKRRGVSFVGAFLVGARFVFVRTEPIR